MTINGFAVTRKGDIVRGQRGSRVLYCRRVNNGVAVCAPHGNPSQQPWLDEKTKSQIQAAFMMIPEAADE